MKYKAYLLNTFLRLLSLGHAKMDWKIHKDN